MLSHLLFSISAFIILIVFSITYFSLNKAGNNLYRVRLYKQLIYVTAVMTVNELLQGVFYVYNLEVLFGVAWKLHLAAFAVFYCLLYNYFLEYFDLDKYTSFIGVFWNKKHILKNIINIIYLLLIVYSLIFIKPYPLGASSFLFYNEESYIYLFIIFLMYIIFTIEIMIKKKKFTTYEHITIIGTFIFNIATIYMAFRYPEISFYCVLFILLLVLFYYFKENADLVYIDELKELKYQIDNSNNAKLDYLYETIHDLVSPINAINTLNKSIRNNESKTIEELNNKLNDLNIVSNDIISIINNPLNTIYNYRIDEMIFRLSKVADTLLIGKNVRFIYDVNPNLPSILVGESTKLYRILLNLIVNAINATDVGRIKVSIDGNIRKDILDMSIRISDTGKGIEEKDYNTLYEKKKSTTNESMSLYLVKKFVDSMNGQINFESHIGSGTVFNIKVSQKIVDMTPVSQNQTVLLNKVVPSNCTGKKVIILDNDYKCTSAVSKIFKKYGFDIEVCTEGKNFIRKIKMGEEYHLILLSDNVKDINYMEIIHVLNYLRKVIKIPPVAAFTSNVVDTKGTFYINNGFDAYLPKPINIRKLDYLIKTKCK